MKNLKERIEEILPEILPKTPEESINGTELAKLVMGKLPGEKESSIRQTFSSLHTEANSSLAKLPNKQGFYLRAESRQDQIVEGLSKKEKAHFEKDQEQASRRDQQREEKFRSIFIRYNELNGYFPMAVEHTKGKKEEKGLNKWKYPDVITVNWEVGETLNDEFRLNTTLLEIRKGLGEQPFQLTSSELKVDVSFSNYREHFFQCVSNSKWAHNAVFAIACDIQDSKLQAELTRLSKSYGITIETYGLTEDMLDSLPDAKAILGYSDSDFEKHTQSIAVSTISAAQGKETIDWAQLNDLRSQNEDFNTLLYWINKCLKDGRAYSYGHYQKLSEIEKRYDSNSR